MEDPDLPGEMSLLFLIRNSEEKKGGKIRSPGRFPDPPSPHLCFLAHSLCLPPLSICLKTEEERKEKEEERKCWTKSASRRSILYV